MPAPIPLATHLLSASVAAGYSTFGTLGFLSPLSSQRHLFNLIPSTPQEASILKTTARLIFARDFSIGLALWWLWYAKRYREMGVAIVAGTVLCGVDCGVVWARRGWEWYVSFFFLFFLFL